MRGTSVAGRPPAGRPRLPRPRRPAPGSGGRSCRCRPPQPPGVSTQRPTARRRGRGGHAPTPHPCPRGTRRGPVPAHPPTHCVSASEPRPRGVVVVQHLRSSAGGSPSAPHARTQEGGLRRWPGVDTSPIRDGTWGARHGPSPPCRTSSPQVSDLPRRFVGVACRQVVMGSSPLASSRSSGRHVRPEVRCEGVTPPRRTRAHRPTAQKLPPNYGLGRMPRRGRARGRELRLLTGSPTLAPRVPVTRLRGAFAARRLQCV